MRDFFSAANEAVIEHNRAVNDIGNQRTTLTAEIWKGLVKEAKDALDACHASKTAVDAAIRGIDAGLTTKRSDLTAAKQKLYLRAASMLRRYPPVYIDAPKVSGIGRLR